LCQPWWPGVTHTFFGEVPEENIHIGPGTWRPRDATFDRKEPRTIADFKPMTVLLQGVLESLLSRELMLVNKPLMEENARIAKRCADYEAFMEEHTAQAARQQMLKMRDKFRTVSFKKKRAEELTEDLRYNVINKTEAIVTFMDQGQLNRQLGEATARLEKTARRLSEMEALVAKKEQIALSARGELKAHKEEKQAALELQLKNRELQKSMDTLRNQKDAHIKKLEESAAMLGKGIEDLKGESMMLKTTDFQFLPWLVHRPVIEYKWAAKLRGEMVAVTVPPSSVVTLPLPKEATDSVWHVVSLPADSLIKLSTDDPFMEAAIPWRSCLTFPGGEGEITLPGGSSLLLPESDKLLSVIVSAGTKIFSGSDTLFAKGVETHEVLGGSTIAIPMYGRRVAATVPSGTCVIVPKAGYWHARVPGGTCVRVGNHTAYQEVMVPADAVITLPKDHAAMPDVDTHVGANLQSLALTARISAGTLAGKNSFVLMLPSGARVELSSSLSKKIGTATVPPGTTVYRPTTWDGDKPALPRITAAPGETVTVTSRLTSRLQLLPGSVIQLPFHEKEVSAQQLAEQLDRAGPEAAGMALGKLCAFDVAEALPLLHPKVAAAILGMARPEVATKVLVKWKGSGQAQTLGYMGVECLGAIIGSMDSDDQEITLNEIYGGDKRLIQDILKQADLWRTAKQAINADIPYYRRVTALSALRPREAALLLAESDSSIAAICMTRLATRSDHFPGKILEELTGLSARIAQLQTRYTENDLHRTHLLAQVSNQASTTTMLHQVEELLGFIKSAYGVGCTLYHREEDAGLCPSASSVPSSQQQEDQEPSEFPILYSTENAYYGPAKRAPPGMNKGNREANGLSVHVPIDDALAAIQEAYQTKALVKRGVLIVMPIFATTGVVASRPPWGALVHVNKMEAAAAVMGGVLGRPLVNSEPLAIENLRQAAEAIATALYETERSWFGKTPENLERELLDLVFIKRDQIPKFAITQQVVDNMSLLLDAHIKDHTLLVRKLSVESDDDLGENKSKCLAAIQTVVSSAAYPSESVRRTLVAMMLYLGGADRKLTAAECLGPKLMSYPADDKQLWGYVKAFVSVPRRHSEYPVKLWKECSPHIIDRSELMSPEAIREGVHAVLGPVKPEDVKAMEKDAVLCHLGDIFHLVSLADKVSGTVLRMNEIIELKNARELEALDHQ